MKKIFYLFALVAILLSGCKGETVDVSGIVAERDSIKETNIKQQLELDNLNAFVGAISNELDSIAREEKFIRVGNPEGGAMTRAQLKQNLDDFSLVLARHRARIAELEDSLNIKGKGAGSLHNIVAYLNEQLEGKEKVINQLRLEVNNKEIDIVRLQSRINSLNENVEILDRKNQIQQQTFVAEVNNKNKDIDRLQSKINTLNENVEQLDKKNKIQQQALVTQSDMMNECFMKIGTKKQLKQAGITDGKRLNAGSLNPDNFVRVDIRQLRELTLNSKKPKILTTMPQSSYSIERNSDGTSLLTINDPTAFWSSSNYLVISLE